VEGNVQSQGHWVLDTFLSCIPFVGLILLIVWSVTDQPDLSKQRWARAMLLWSVIGVIVGVVVTVLFGALVAGLAGAPLAGLIGCALCGFSVGIMWPGSISISSQILPTGGTAMFALLALAGDLGGAVGPAIIGNVSQKAANNLQAGVLAGIGFPIVLVISVLYIRRKYNQSIIFDRSY
jgi:fucose permease